MRSFFKIAASYLTFIVYSFNAKAQTDGKSKLRIEKLSWMNGWPVVFQERNN